MENEYFWLQIVIISIGFIVLFLAMPKIIEMIDKFVEKKTNPKKEESGEEKKRRYKTF